MMTKKEFFIQILKQEEDLLNKDKDIEKVPEGYLLSGFDFKMVKPIVALNEIYRVDTQWSCQGHQDSRWDYAYIRLAEGSKIPDDLVEKLEKNGHTCGYIRPYSDNPAIKVFVMRSFNSSSGLSLIQKKERNDNFCEILNNFAKELLETWIKNS